MSHDNPKVVAIVVNYNGARITKECLSSLVGTKASLVRVLVDNGSEEPVGPLLGDDQSVVLLRSEKNVGFAGGVNLGLTWALGEDFEYVLIMNNDVTASPESIDAMCDFLDKCHEAAAVSPIVLWDGDRRGVWYAGGSYSLWTGVPSHARRLTKDPSPKVVTFIPFCAVLIRREDIDAVGNLDSRFFMYAEDVEYCLRLRSAGRRLYLLPTVAVAHAEGGTTSKTMSRKAQVSLATRNLLDVHRQYGRARHMVPFWTYFVVRWVLLQGISGLVRRRTLLFGAFWAGFTAHRRGAEVPR